MYAEKRTSNGATCGRKRTLNVDAIASEIARVLDAVLVALWNGIQDAHTSGAAREKGHQEKRNHAHTVRSEPHFVETPKRINY
jgi:hypothetical protein